MSDKRDIASIRDEVRQALDLDEWKSSWHLPKDSSGKTDWYSVETYAQVKKVIYDKMVDANARIDFLGRLYYDEIDWEHPLEMLRDELRAVEYAILEEDYAPGETFADLQAERRKLEALIADYEPILVDDELSKTGVVQK